MEFAEMKIHLKNALGRISDAGTSDQHSKAAGRGLETLVSGRTVVAGAIAALAMLAWTLTVFNIGPMFGTPTLPLNYAALSLFAASWTVSMVAMMFPTAVPMLLMFLHVGRRTNREVREGGGPTPGKAILFVATYIGAWLAAGILFYVGAAVLLSRLPLAVNLFIGTTFGLGVALIMVAAYQLSPIKGECLDRCHPNSFLFRFYRSGVSGSFLMGLDYAKYCVGCCWMMMLFLLVSASMGLAWMVAFTAIIFAERNLTFRSWVPKAFGVGFLLAGVALVLF
jgi:predicted metal-binding membrane protein